MAHLQALIEFFFKRSKSRLLVAVFRGGALVSAGREHILAFNVVGGALSFVKGVLGKGFGAHLVRLFSGSIFSIVLIFLLFVFSLFLLGLVSSLLGRAVGLGREVGLWVDGEAVGEGGGGRRRHVGQ